MPTRTRHGGEGEGDEGAATIGRAAVRPGTMAEQPPDDSERRREGS